MKLPHLIHRDPDWQQRGCHFYYQCRCGARRVRSAYLNMSGPVEPGWPPLLDGHGVPVNDSGWHVLKRPSADSGAGSDLDAGS